MARTRVTGGDERLFAHLRTLRQGQTLTEQAIINITGWTTATLKTYRSKHKFTSFLAFDKQQGIFQVLRDGEGLTYNEFSQNFTQVNPEEHVPAKGIVLPGESRRYTLIEKIGYGAVAEVWKCYYTLNDVRSFAAAKIMVPRAEFLESSKIKDIAKRFQKEAVNGRQFIHPNIVRILDKGLFGDKPFAIMELADGSARSLVASSSNTSITLSATVVNAAARGLTVLHSKNCVHRDIKPDNILVRQGQYLLGDLGVALWDYLNPAFTRAGTLTRDSVILGSLLYMAPEQQKKSKGATSASDIYSLGVTWIELLTGEIPGPADIVAGNYESPSSNTDVNDFIKQMITYLPAARPSASNVVDFTQALLEEI